MRTWAIGLGVLLAAGSIWLLTPPAETPREEADGERAPDTEARAPTLAARDVPARDAAAEAWTGLLARLRAGKTGRGDERLFDEVMARHRKSALTLEELLTLALLPAKEAYSSWGSWARQELAKRREEVAPHLARVLRLLGHDDEAQRDAAALTIGHFAPLDPAHVPLIVKAFEREPVDYTVARKLVTAMEGMGPEIRPLAPHLIRFVEDLLQGRAKTEADFSGSISWDHVEYEVDELLAVLGADAIPPLLEALDRQLEAKAQAEREAGGDLGLTMNIWDPASWTVRTLRELGADAVPTLLALMRHARADVRSDAADVLSGLKLQRDDIRLLLQEDLAEGDVETREQAAVVLRTQGKAAVAALVRALADDDAGVRNAAATSLAELGVRSEAALAPLLERVKGKNMFTALSAAETIARWGRAAAPAFPVLARAFRGDEWHDIRLSRLLAKLIAHDTTVLGEAFADGSPGVRAGVAQTIGRLDTVDGPLADILARAAADGDLSTRVHAAAALARHGRLDHLNVLAEGLGKGLVTASASGLAHHGADARALLPQLIEHMIQMAARPGYRDDQEAALDEAVAAIGAFDLEFVQPLLTHESIDVKVAALYAFQRAGRRGLAHIERAWPDASPDLREQMIDVPTGLLRKQGVDESVREAAWSLVARASTDTVPAVRKATCYQLGREVGRRPDALDLLVARIGDENGEVAGTAAYLVKGLGAKAAPARAALARHRDHPDGHVRRYVRAALDRLEK